MSDRAKRDLSSGHPVPWASYLVGLIVGMAVAAVGGLVVAGPLVVAHRQDLPLERLYGNFAVSIAARLNAGSQTNPLAGNERAISTGRAAYTGSCSVCHGATGDGKGAFGQATYPPATPLVSHDVQEKSDAQLFWIIKNGLSFTGMPAYGEKYADQDIWSLVSYIRALKGGQAAEVVPTPTAEQLAVADPAGDATQRGAAFYFAQNCANCHGAIGNAPGDLALRNSRELEEAVRRGRRGMPAYSAALLTDAQLADLQAYVGTFPTRPRSGREG